MAKKRTPTSNTKAIPEWTTRTMRVEDLTPADYNPRKISDRAAKALRASLERFGDLGGIVFNDRTKRLVGGHQRAKVLAALGVETTDVRVVDLDEGEEKIANITLNNGAISGEWDDGALKLLLEDAKRDFPIDFDELLLGDLMVEGSPDAPRRTQVEGGQTREIDVDGFALAHACPRCGFEFNDR